MVTPKSGAARPRRTTAMILFAGMRGFTHTTQSLDPPVVLTRASEFFALVAAAVERHDGTVVNVLNDTLMAIFAGPGEAQHAAQAAREIRRDFTVLRAGWQSNHGIRAAVAIALHGGEMVCGAAGGPLHAQQLVVGDSVNVAARLLGRTRAGEFVVTKTVMDALAASQFVLEAKELPPFKIPHREPIRIFGVLLDTRLDFA